MTDLSPYHTTSPVPTGGGRHVRAIGRQRLGAQLRASQVDLVTDVAIVKSENLTAATGQAMSDIVRIAQVQRQLEQLVPEASGRLAMLADRHALALGELVDELRRDLHRL